MVNTKIISLPLFSFTTTTSFLSFSHITLNTPNSSIPNPNSPISLYIQNQTPPSSFRSPKTQFSLSRLSGFCFLSPKVYAFLQFWDFAARPISQGFSALLEYLVGAVCFFPILHTLISGGITRTGL